MLSDRPSRPMKPPSWLVTSAAGVTKTGNVGTFGGMQIPTVTIFMDGFARGVAYYNEIHGTAVETLVGTPLLRPVSSPMTSAISKKAMRWPSP